MCQINPTCVIEYQPQNLNAPVGNCGLERSRSVGGASLEFVISRPMDQLLWWSLYAASTPQQYCCMHLFLFGVHS